MLMKCASPKCFNLVDVSIQTFCNSHGGVVADSHSGARLIRGEKIKPLPKVKTDNVGYDFKLHQGLTDWSIEGVLNDAGRDRLEELTKSLTAQLMAQEEAYILSGLPDAAFLNLKRIVEKEALRRGLK